MFGRLTTGASVVLGLVLGLIISYFGLKFVFAKALDILQQDALASFSTVEIRLQQMADEALELRPTLKRLHWHGKESPFVEVEAFRSKLAGRGVFGEKVEAAQNLEKSLIEVAELWKGAGKHSKKVASDYYWQEYGRHWQSQLEYLVNDEKEAEAAVAQYNKLVGKWPTSWVAKGYRLPQMIVASVKALRAKHKDALAKVDQAASGVAAKILDKVGSPAQTEAGQLVASQEEAKKESARFEPLAQPKFVAWAPLPEDYKEEVQYRSMPSMVVVEEEKMPKGAAAYQGDLGKRPAGVAVQ